MFYSLEKFPDGSFIVFGHFSFGIMPLIAFAKRTQLQQFINLLQDGLVVDIPLIFREAFGENT